MLTTYNHDLLNNFFTNHEFDFIEHMDSDMESDYILLEKQRKGKVVVTKLISELTNLLYSNNIDNESRENVQETLKSAKNILEVLNYNIELLELNCDLSTSIKNDLVSLLVKIDADGENVSESNYITEISDLRKKISDVGDRLKNPNIESNNEIISNFFTDYSVKKYLQEFSLEYDDKVEENIRSTNFSRESFDTSDTASSYDINEDNNLLLISEKYKRVYLPYSKAEVLAYLEKYPNQYKSFEDVVRKEFIFSTEWYSKHPVIARFREAYSLIRDKEAKSVLESFKFALEIMFKYELHPAIVAACKSQSQLENYLSCLAKKDLSTFTDFQIKFEALPTKYKKIPKNS